jgi:hypothetical protein
MKKKVEERDDKMSTYRYGKKTYLKRKTKKVTDLYEKVKEYMLFLRDCDDEAFYKKTGYSYRCFTKERVAKVFQVREHEIRYCFDRLNQEGILRQPVKRRGEERWSPNRYYFIQKYEKFYTALQESNIKTLEKEVEEGLDLNKAMKDKNGFSYLLTRNNLKVLRWALSKHADPTYGDEIGNIAQALMNHSLDIIQELLQASSNPYATDEEGNNLLLLLCKESDDVEKLRFLLDYGFSLKEKNKLKQTPLMMAAKHNKVKVVSYLLSQKVDRKTKDMYKKTAFMYALEQENKEILRLFIPFRHELTRDERKLFKQIRMRLLF